MKGWFENLKEDKNNVSSAEVGNLDDDDFYETYEETLEDDRHKSRRSSF